MPWHLEGHKLDGSRFTLTTTVIVGRTFVLNAARKNRPQTIHSRDGAIQSVPENN